MTQETKNKKKHKFLSQPQYPGGKSALQAFIKANLRYPEDALSQGVKGVVIVSYQVNDNGEVENPTILKGLFPSCDEEALRLVNLLRYAPVYNRGVRLKSNCKLNIIFRTPEVKSNSTRIVYNLTPSVKKPLSPPHSSRKVGYSITIKES